MPRTSKPIIEVCSEVKDYYRYYVIRYKPFPAMAPHIAKFDGIIDLMAFCTLMRSGIYGATVGTGNTDDDLKIESELRFANIRIVGDT